jgi:AbiV family abortive infection protein
MGNNKDTERLKKIIDTCQSHANDLLNAARKILDDGISPNIAYHLAALALEEIGKSSLIGMIHTIKTEKGDNIPWAEKQIDDHVKKLYWALWGPSFGRELLTTEQIESYIGLAQTIHENCISGLYVDTLGEEIVLPKDRIMKAEAENIINIAEARIQMAMNSTYGELDDERKVVMSWFLNANDDEQKRKLIMGRKSMEKLVELGNVPTWIDWLKKEFDEADKVAFAQMERELKRSKPIEEDERNNKWKVKIRLHSNSHSIRPKVLNEWNKLQSWITLFPVDKKNDQLDVQFTFPKSVPIQGLWWAGWSAAKTFAVALNIGSMGFFWWYVPEHISRFYESIKDLESNMDVRVERSPVLKLDWQHAALSERDLRETALCLGMLGHRQNDDVQNRIYGHYIQGLSFLSKNDIHLQFESNAYDCFYKCLKYAMQCHGDWDGQSAFPGILEQFLSSLNIGDEETKKHMKIGEQFEVFPPNTKGITLSEVGAIKIVCDAYLKKKFIELANAERKEKNIV